MTIIKCKMCGGDIAVSEDKTFGTCEYCGSTMTFPKVSDEQRAALFNRGNHFRRQGEFDKALSVYENIVRENDADAEAHWCCALCRFGIEYVEDPNTFEYLPTCHRASFDSFLEDVDYLAAIEHSDGITRRQYQKDAAKIAEVQRGILATSQNEEPFDVFICYKESENDGSRTRDSLLAQDIYYQLTEQGRRVFFSRITLEDKAGTEYEPYIFAALNSAKVMILVTTSAEHANAVWVKNEWSRFLSLMRKDRSKLLLPCYRDMDPYDLPEALSVLQSYDISKIGFIQDLIRGVNKVLDASRPKETVKETVVVQQQGNASVAPLLKRAFMFLEDGDFARADEFCEQVLNLDPENSDAYLGKLMAELHVKTRDALKDQPEPFNDRNSFKKAYRFGDEKLKAKLSGDIAFIKERNETARLTGIYNTAVQAMNAASTESEYKSAAATFQTIPGFRDADALAERCLEQAEICRKNAIYQSARSQMTGTAVSGYESAIKTFRTIPGWKDADDQIIACQRKIEEIMEQQKRDKEEAERRAAEEAKRQQEERIAKEIAKEKAAKKRKLTIAIVIPIIAACIGFVILLTTVIIPNQKYNAAVKLYNTGEYEDAIAAFTALGEYKDSAAQIEKCEIAIKDEKYAAAVELYTAGKYEDAIATFTALDGYKDSVEQVAECQYAAAIELYNAGKYEDAIAVFTALDGYKDSAEKISEIKPKYYKQLLSDASVGSKVYFGSYEQDNDTSNGKEDIEWTILAKEENKALVISKLALDCQPYNTSYTTSITWETCSLRKWLNQTFLNDAFSTDEQELLLVTTVSNDDDNTVTDKVFLLSIAEVDKYFNSREEKLCKGTEYCLQKGASKTSNRSEFGPGNCSWWLRSAGTFSGNAAYVSIGGVANKYGDFVSRKDFTIRPAIWIGLG